tara:strand:+ start:3609 stop:4226 length:618 start_codon:yes stop_codon:yes gene_type:complete
MEAKDQKKTFLEVLKDNLKTIIIFFLLLFSIFSIFSWMKYDANIKKQKLSEDFIKAKIFISEKKFVEANDILKDIVNQKDSTYSVLSLYLIINKDLEKDEKLVIKYFDKILSIKALKKEDLNLIKLKKAIYISRYEKEEDLLDLLNPIINSESFWKAQSIKFLGDYYFSKREYNKADEYYSILLNLKDPNIDNKDIQRRINTYKK